MCGIAGMVSMDPRRITLPGLKAMTDAIAHRGPDGHGHWINENGKVGLAHRRLSIIDLSHSADQPMHYLDRYTIVFNGEIYNYVELKAILIQQGYTFKTASDTEVLMALYHRDKERCLQLLDGMFAFVIYDKEEETVFCVRDRFGEKPLFYNYEPGKHFIFGSEIKALWAGGVLKEINRVMLYNYLQGGYWANPYDVGETFYSNCARLEQSHYLKLNLNDLSLVKKRYYDIDWQNIDLSITEEAATERMREIFYTSVSRRLRSDVPVGSSLSGGLDSSLVVSVINELKKGTDQVQKTFSAIFPGFEKDESKYIRIITDRLNVEPHFVTPTDEDMINNLEKLFYHQEEPFGSASIYVQYCVMQLARQNGVTVMLDGQGADEILAGYHPYFNFFFHELRRTDVGRYEAEMNAYNALHSDNQINGLVKANKTTDIIKAHIPFAVTHLKKVRNIFKRAPKPFLNREFEDEFQKQIFQPREQLHSLNHSLYNDIMHGGIQVLLGYADRNSMAHSLEVRLPFLSHELVNFLFTLPVEFKIRDGWTKWIMRKTFSDILPPEICWRKDKIGFEPPQKKWMSQSSMKERIMDARETLVKEHILDKKILGRDIVATDSNYRGDNSWPHLMASEVFKININT